MHRWLERLAAWYRARCSRLVRVIGVQQLGAGMVVYAVEVDGRRVVFAASSRAICALDRYETPADRGTERDRCEALAK